MIRFREVVIDDAQKILDWRTSRRVTRFMKSDLEYNLESQKKWLAGVFSKVDYYPWVIQFGGKDIGLLYLEDFNFEKKETSWGFYIGEEDALGVGGMVPPCFYNFAFGVLGVDRILADVFYDNTSVIDLHLKQGCQFDPERDHVIQKNGEDILLVGMVLKRETFKASKFSRLEQELPISKWQARPHAAG